MYSDKNINNDIGLLLLKDDLPLGDKIKRVIISKQNNFGLQAVVAGWGLVNVSKKYNKQIFYVAKGQCLGD